MKKLYLFSAVIYCCMNMNAQNWNEQADIPVDLTFPVVVELNGYIHVMGGGTGQGATGYHTRFDPVNNSWDTMADVPYEAQQPAGAVVNGKIHYCGGGFPNSGTPLDDHYYYDPALDEWFEVADLPTARVIHEAVSLNGKLYVMSGQPDKDRFDVYDPVLNSWDQLSDLPDDNFWYGAIVATSNTIYRFGGGGYLGPQDLAYEYDVENDEWIALPDMPVALHAPAGVVINDLLIYIGGGYNTVDLDEGWLYNTASHEYTPSDSLPEARTYHSFANANDCIYSVGGYNFNIDEMGVDLISNCEISATNIPDSFVQNDLNYDFISNSSSFCIKFNEESLGMSKYSRIMDIKGNLVSEEAIGRHDLYQFNAPSSLANGIYVVVINIGNESLAERWVVSR